MGWIWPQWRPCGARPPSPLSQDLRPGLSYAAPASGRVASANCGASIWNQNFSFDPFGNIQKTVPQGSTGTQFLPTYSPTTNRYQSVPGCTPSYDANGFLTNDCSHTYLWDVAGNPRGIDNVCLVYDALGRMVEQQRGASCGSPYTEVVYSAGGGKLALMNGQTLVKAFVPLPMGASAVYVPTTGLAYYRRADWLGSARLVSKPDGSLYYKTEYAPYGENYHGASGSGGSQVLEFTGQNQDTVGGLYDFMFREYNTNHGRWPWPDPAGMGAVSVESPQTWNRYAYVGNLPLTSVDPLGLEPHWAKMDALRNGNNCFAVPGCSTNPFDAITDASVNAFLLDFGAAWLNYETQQFYQQAGLNSPMEQAYQQHLRRIPGYQVQDGNLLVSTGYILVPGYCPKDVKCDPDSFSTYVENW